MDQYPLEKYFDDAANQIKDQKKNLKKEPTSDDLLKLYGYFKFANLGKNNTPKPGMFSFEAKAKWEGWNSCDATCQQDAKHKYVLCAMQFLPNSVTSNYQ